MKIPIALVVGAAVLLSAVLSQAQDAKPSGSTGKQAAATPSMPMMAQMDDHMKKMQVLHDRMMSASTPEERQKAMQEARKEMQEGMTMMKPMMQGGGMMGGGAMGGTGKSGDPQQQMQTMGKRMDMMQMMMQMMMDQQGMMPTSKGPGPTPAK